MATISLSPTFATAFNPSAVITVTGSGTSFNGTSLSISGGCGNVITTQSASSGTAGSLTILMGAPDFGNITVTDTLSGATATLTVNPPNLGPLVIGFVGDSITAGTNGTPLSQPESEGCIPYLSNQGYSVTYYNFGWSGSSTADWLPGGTLMNGVLANIASLHIPLMHIMLGTNDSRSSVTPAQHFSNMTSIVNAIVAAGCNVIISKPLYTGPNALGAWPIDSTQLYRQYFALDCTLTNGVTVFQGDTSNFSYGMQNAPTFLADDEVHPRDAASNGIVGRNWAIAIMQMFGVACPNMAISYARNSVMVMP